MIIKKYQAKTENEAMNLARAELGDSCVSLNVRVVKQKGIMKLIKAPYVEVTVALEEESETDYDSLIKPIVNPMDDRNIFKPSGFNVVVDENTKTSVIEPEKETPKETVVNKDVPVKEENPSSDIRDNTFKDNLDTASAKTVKKDKKSREIKSDSEMDAVYELISQTLIDNEVDEDYVEEIVEEAKSRLKTNTPMDTVLSHILDLASPKPSNPQRRIPRLFSL